MIPCLIPLKDGHWIHPDVLSGLLRQTVSVRLTPVTRPAVGGTYESQAITRNCAFQLLPEIRQEGFAVMMDRDTVLTDRSAVERAITRMIGEEDLKAVHLRLKDNPSHFDIGCFVFKTEIAPNVAFSSERGECNCGGLSRALEARGWRQDWLDGERHGSVITYID